MKPGTPITKSRHIAGMGTKARQRLRDHRAPQEGLMAGPLQPPPSRFPTLALRAPLRGRSGKRRTHIALARVTGMCQFPKRAVKRVAYQCD